MRAPASSTEARAPGAQLTTSRSTYTVVVDPRGVIPASVVNIGV